MSLFDFLKVKLIKDILPSRKKERCPLTYFDNWASSKIMI